MESTVVRSESLAGKYPTECLSVADDHDFFWTTELTAEWEAVIGTMI